MRRPNGVPDLTPGAIATAYALFGLAWIAVSDVILFTVFTSQEVITAIQTLKGGVFVALSAAVIWLLTARRERQLQEFHDRLEAATQRLQVLQRVFRHNVRNDLNVVRGYIDMAKAETDTERVRRRLDTASATTENVLEISDKLKVLDNYAADIRVREQVDLGAILDQAVESYRAEYPAASVSLDRPETVSVVGDSSVAYVIEELLENTAEHYEGSLKTLSVAVGVREDGTEMVVTVADNGPGIPEGELEALRAGHESDLTHLSSVGYWLVYWLCDRIGASIDVESAPQAGTEVTIRFRKARPRAPFALGETTGGESLSQG